MDYTTLQKEFISTKDIMAQADISEDKAQKVMRQIKSVSDVFGLAGRVHISDYVKYIETQLESDAHTAHYDKR